MRTSKLIPLALIAAAVGGAALTMRTSAADKAAAEHKRAANVHYLMEGLVEGNYEALTKAMEGDEIKWKAVKMRASMMNEAGFVLMDDNRCPDDVWAGACKALQVESVALLQAVEKQDTEAAKAAFGKLSQEGCAACHKVHKHE